MNNLWLIRLCAFVLACILSLVIIALCAISNSNLSEILLKSEVGRFPYASLGIAIGVITLVSMIIMIVLDFFVDNFFTSYMIFELSWTSLLWVLWIAVGGTTLANGKTLFQGATCEEFDLVSPKAKDVCNDIHPIASVAFVTFALFFIYGSLLVVLSFRSSSTGWTTSVKNRSK
ncbi:hypothetical protein BC628DRAFT_991744 [Trametes gibbosa]|nr:hypothetical protein BC628DRAFT_991744 [Trametes gibbosa]